MNRVLTLITLLTMPGAVQAQSMNVRLITDTVLADVCRPMIEQNSLWAAVGGAERLGYAVMDVEPVDLAIGAASRQPEPRAVTFYRPQRGTVRVSRHYDQIICAIGLDEGGADRAAEAAAPHLRALGLSPLIEEEDADPPLAVWRGEGRLLVIAPSPHHPPGVELILTVHAPRRD